MNLVHYGEVHRIGGDEFFELLKGRLLAWKTEFLTGTSATPRTANPAQHRKISELFGDPYTLLHKCDIDDAIAEEWIAQPRFSIHIVSKNKERADLIRQFLNIVRRCIEYKKEIGNWKGGKVIVYLPLREEVREAVRLASTVFPPEWKIFRAVEDMSVADDKEFVNEPADGLPRILFACERYREGSDITGLEMTGILMGNTIAANILIQIIGRALRADYKGKEGWCCIFRPSEEGTTEEDVLDQILLEITEILGRNDLPMTPKEIRRMVETFFGETTLRDKLFSIEETVARVQAIYERREYQRNPCAETIRRQCIVRNITHTSEYNNVKEEMGWANAPWERMDLTPYAFFHPEINPICERTVLTNLLRAQNIFTTEAYKTWRTEQTELYPSVEHINDGYFRGTVNLQDILPQGNRRR
jgi:hypothetical protein